MDWGWGSLRTSERVGRRGGSSECAAHHTWCPTKPSLSLSLSLTSAPYMVPALVGKVSNRAMISAISASLFKAEAASCGLLAAAAALMPAGSGACSSSSTVRRTPLSYQDSTTAVGGSLLKRVPLSYHESTIIFDDGALCDPLGGGTGVPVSALSLSSGPLNTAFLAYARACARVRGGPNSRGGVKAAAPSAAATSRIVLFIVGERVSSPQVWQSEVFGK